MNRFTEYLDRNWARIAYTYFRTKQKAGFLEMPDDVQWLATSRCNLSCLHCGSDSSGENASDLQTGEMLKIIDELASMGVKYLTLTGGEPLLREDLFEVLEHAGQKGIQYNLVTNSTYVRKFSSQLEKLPPAAVKVSIDGTPEIHAAIRGDAENFEDCMNALGFFNHLGVNTRMICTTLNQKNFDCIQELFKYVLSSEASFWEFHLPISEGRAAANKDWMFLSPQQKSSLFRFIVENQEVFNIFAGEGCGYCGKLTGSLYMGRRFFCGSGWTTFTIMSDGKIAGCPAFQDEWTEGDARNDSLRSLWKKGFSRFRNVVDSLDEDCRKCEFLNACLGGCWMHRRTGDHCHRESWEPLCRDESSV